MQDKNTTLVEGNATETGPVPHPAQEVAMWTGILIVIVLNIMVFVVAPRMKTIRPVTLYGILSLAVTDLLVGLVSITNNSYNMYIGYKQTAKHPVCIIMGIGISLTSLASAWTMTFMNVDRLLIFAFPLRYDLSKRKAIIVNVLIWLCVIATLLPGASNAIEPSIRYYKYAFLCKPDNAVNVQYKLGMLFLFFIFPMVINVICFCGYFYFAHKSHRFVQSLQVPQEPNIQQNRNSHWQHDAKIVKTLAFMTVGYYIAWIPYNVMVTIPELLGRRSADPVIEFVGIWLVGTNSWYNPVVYILTLRPFKTALAEIWRGMPCTQKKPEHSRINKDAITPGRTVDVRNKKDTTQPGEENHM